MNEEKKAKQRKKIEEIKKDYEGERRLRKKRENKCHRKTGRVSLNERIKN